MPPLSNHLPGRALAFAFALASVTAVAAQAPTVPEAPSTEAFDAHLRAAATERLAAYRGDHRRQLRHRYDERDEGLRDAYAAGAFLREGEWARWLGALTERVRTANPEWLGGVALVPLVRRSPAVNARCYGNGVVAVDLGLLARAPSADAVAFALCHELAHQALDHVDRSAAAHLEALYAGDTQRALRRARRDGGYDDFVALTERLAFDRSRHTRFGERAADSLGLVFYRAAGFAPEAPAALLRVLAKADRPADAAPLPLHRLLDTEAYPFDEAWTRTPTTAFLAKADALSPEARDALRTHPETAARLAALARAGVDTAAAPVPDDAYLARRASVRYLLTEAAFDHGRLDLALYHALRGVEADDADADARGAAALALADLARARAALHFDAVAPLPSTLDDEHVRALAELLHRLRRTQLQHLARAYAAEVPEALATPQSLAAVVIAGPADAADRARVSAAEARLRKTYPDHAVLAWLN